MRGRKRSRIMKDLIGRYRSAEDAEAYMNYRLDRSGSASVTEAAKEILELVPPGLGECAQLSASWAAGLRNHTDVPAIVVAGDLRLHRKPIFRCSKNLPMPSNTGRIIAGTWQGHCWIDIGGVIGDLSIFRTAYSLSDQNEFRHYMQEHFGIGRGALLSEVESLPPGLAYIPKYVLTDAQIDSLVAGVGYRLERIGALPP